MKRRMFTGGLAAIGILLLILDAKTALSGAAEGINICLRVIIPSLFPFFILSVLLTDCLFGMTWKIFSPLCRILRIPRGAESLLFIGVLGGYPVGAQTICQAWESGMLTGKDAHRMLGFCNNAGPAFLFGLVATQFTGSWIPWVLWGIHVLSAFITGILLPGSEPKDATLRSSNPISIPQAMERSLKIMGSVCGWIILFRIIQAFLERWFLWIFPSAASVAVKLLLELANGCLSLNAVQNDSLRFLLCSCGLALGGICVTMQTVSVTTSLGLGMYLPGKLLQTVISFVLSLAALYLLPGFETAPVFLVYAAISSIILTIFLLFLRKMKNNSRNLQTVGV